MLFHRIKNGWTTSCIILEYVVKLFHLCNKICTIIIMCSLSHNNHCFQCNITITYEIKFDDFMGQSIVPLYSFAKIQKHG